MEVNLNSLNLNNITLIDIRENYEYKMNHIDNAINIPIDTLELVPEKYLKKNKKYYLYCDLGVKSRELSLKLNKMGYKIYSIKGGYKEYKNTN